MRRVFRLAVAGAVVLSLALGGAASSYGPPPVPSWVVSGGTNGGSVEALAVAPGSSTAYVGGNFSYVGPETGSFVAFDPANGAPVSPWPTVGGSVYAVVSD